MVPTIATAVPGQSNLQLAQGEHKFEFDGAQGIRPRLGAWLTEDQEWCLECGAARTRIQGPPDWRIGVAIVAAVIVVIVVVVAIAWP